MLTHLIDILLYHAICSSIQSFSGYNIYSASASHAYPPIHTDAIFAVVCIFGFVLNVAWHYLLTPPLAATPTVTPPTSFIKIMHCMAAPKLGWCRLRLLLPPSLHSHYSHSFSLASTEACVARHVKRHFVSAAVSGTSSL